MLNKIAGALGQVAEGAGTIVGIRHGTEEPSFTVERRVGSANGEVEIRRYGPRIAAETTIDADEEAARNEGFRRLARYIFGGNQGKTKIAMTAPVVQEKGQKIAMTAPVAAQRGSTGQWVIRFFMPSEPGHPAGTPRRTGASRHGSRRAGGGAAILRNRQFRGCGRPHRRTVADVAGQRHSGRWGTVDLVLRPAVDDPVPASQ
jgi:hypothetical protein